jgi:hypothetical protein
MLNKSGDLIITRLPEVNINLLPVLIFSRRQVTRPTHLKIISTYFLAGSLRFSQMTGALIGNANWRAGNNYVGFS